MITDSTDPHDQQLQEPMESQDPSLSKEQRALREFQRQMLDLTLRNPLLNYRPSKRFGLDIVNEDPAQIISWFMEESRSFKFHASKASRRKVHDLDDQALALATDGEEANDLGGFDDVLTDEASSLEEIDATDNPEDSLETPYTPEVLHARLEQTSRNAKLFYQERGVGALYLTVGMLVWYEAPASERKCEAPLILFPAAIDRKSARAQWRLQGGAEDPGVNISLAEKMKEFGLILPTEWDVDGQESALAYLAQVRELLVDMPDKRWAVDDRRMTLGFYSFARFLMWRDLSETQWPADAELLGHPIVQGMMGMGFREPSNPLSEKYKDLDAEREQLGEFTEVVDIDGSQAEVLVQVVAGRNVVVQGPPGTGKSQTITNLIVDSVARGLKVLFVADKMAALQVVAGRMESIGLDALCLELHSNKASKRALATEIFRTLELAEPDPPEDLKHAVSDAGRYRAHLNAYAHAVADGAGVAEICLSKAVGLAARGQRLCPDAPSCDVSGLANLTPGQRRLLKEELDHVATTLRPIGVPSQHAFVGTRIEQVTPSDVPRILAKAKAFLVALQHVQQAGTALAEAMQVRLPSTAGAVGELVHFASLVVRRPDGAEELSADGVIFNSDQIDQSVQVWLQLLNERDEIISRFQKKATGDLWATDLREARGEIIATCDRLFLVRWFSKPYKSAIKTVRMLCEPPAPQAIEALVQIAGAAIRVREIVQALQNVDPKAYQSLGTAWKADKTDGQRLATTMDWVRSSRQTMRAMPSNGAQWGQVAVRVDVSVVRERVPPAHEALVSFRQAWNDISEQLQVEEWNLDEVAFDAVQQRCERWEREMGTIQDWAAYQRRTRPLLARQLTSVLRAIELGEVTPGELIPFVEGKWGEHLVAQALSRESSLAQFDVPTQALTRDRYVEADHQLLHQRRYEIARQHWNQLPKAVAHGRVGYVRKHLNPSRRQLPAIRVVMKEAGEVIQQIKPVFLMSPLSIASFLPPGVINFDLVIFDEASQVRPADALGAIARSKQVVIVGDPMQMPPTSFFDKLIAHDDESDQDGAQDVVTDAKSILDLATANGMPKKMLRWHYRSRHESLIALSNREFYNNELLIYPSPERVAGLSLVPVPDGVYDTGKSKTNVIEAAAIAETALLSFRSDPGSSLGLVALSVAQQNAILNEINLRRRQHQDFDAWCSDHLEPLFVKNLENVQGDERDIILISIGYGRVAVGGPVLNRFGPINNEGGERRLNVLFTRSRKACKIFANFTADDLRLDGSKSKGVEILRKFLKYAETGILPVDNEQAAEAKTESPFEDEVQYALRKHGIEAQCQIGSGGYRIDFGIIDPEKPGRFILGVECDGAMYHSSKWARDRDRLRQEVLESLGWRLHRIWSTDWFQDRERALKRLLEAIASARGTGVPEFKRRHVAAVKRKQSGSAQRTATAPMYKEVRLNNTGKYHDVDQIPADKLQAAVQYVVKFESPVLADEVCTRIVRSVCDRATDRRKEAVRVVIDRLVQQSKLRKEGNFLLAVDQPVIARDYSRRSGVSIEHIYPGEIDAALRQVIEESMGCSQDESVKQVCQLFGLTGTAKNRDGIRDRLMKLQP